MKNFLINVILFIIMWGGFIASLYLIRFILDHATVTMPIMIVFIIIMLTKEFKLYLQDK